MSELKPQPWGVFQCARCKQDHRELSFTKFVGNPVEDEDGTIWNWWAMCPVTGDPILAKIEPPTEA